MDIHSSNDDESDALNQHVQEPGDPDGLIAAEKQKQWEQNQPASHPKDRFHVDYKRRWPMVLAIFGGVLVLLTGVYFLGYQHAKVPITKQTEAAKQKSDRQTAKPTTVTKRYNSDNYTLSMDYPQNWVVADTDKSLTITSPNYAMRKADGSKADGHILVTIQNQQPTVAGYPSDSAISAIVSQKLTYKAPSAVQRAQTYLSFLGYGGASTLDALYLTGDNAYQVGQNIPATDLAKGNPLIRVEFVACTRSFCTGGNTTPIALDPASWKAADFSKQVTTLLESLVFN